MEIETCRQAGVLASKCDALSEIITRVQSAIDAGNTIQNLTLRTMDAEGNLLDIPLGTFDVTASTAALNLAKTILQAQLDAVNTQLSSL